MKILEIDIETAPNLAHVWGLFKQNIGVNQLLETGRVMCFAAKWYGKSGIDFMSEYEHGHEAMLKHAWALLDEADAVVSYNGKKFDMPTLNKEFVKIGLGPPGPYRHIDLYNTARSQFRFASNKLDHLCRELGLGKKVRHPGHELWIECMNGDARAWRTMKRYNIHDVLLLDRLYRRFQPWVKGHPNVSLYTDELARPMCPKCGSHKLHKRGLAYTAAMVYHRYQCTKCGAWARSRVSDMPADHKVNSLVEIR